MVIIDTLGERIRKIRKAKKMTLEALAGDKLTKGMVSLIENNKAQPSMDSLAHIASQLNVDLSYLLQEDKSELRNLLDKVEKVYHTPLNESLEKAIQKYDKIVELIEPHLSEFGNGYETARLYELYGYSLFYREKNGWQEYLDNAAKIYEKMNLFDKRAKLGVFHAFVKFTEQKFQEALDILIKERKEIEERTPNVDPLSRLNFDYNEAVFRFAVGEIDPAIQVIESAIEFSKTQRIFYRIDDLYRLAAAYGILFDDEERLNYYTNKLMHYGEFADEPFYQDICKFMKSYQFILFKKDYQRAWELVKSIPKNDLLDAHVAGLKGQILYRLGRYKEALEALNKRRMPKPIKFVHPFDLSLLYIADVYKALCHLELENLEQALSFATIAKENFEPIPDNRFKDLTNQVYREIVERVKEAAMK